MYPFPHLRGAWEQWWEAVRREVPDAPPLTDDVDLHESWRRPDLFLGHTCGWPLVTELGDDVAVVGAFDLAVPFAAGGRYRTAVVASKPRGLDAWRADPSTRYVANNVESLSGWVSLQVALGATPEVRFTGAHLESLRALARGEADVASIDSLTLEYAAESEPYTVGSVHVVGHGPLVPVTPLVTSRANAALVPVLRAAIAATMADPALRTVLSRLRIRGFVPFEYADYAPLTALLPAG